MSDQLPGAWTPARSKKLDECTFDGGCECLLWPLDAVHTWSLLVWLFCCNCSSVITSHLVNSWNCLLPQKCFKLKFYITVLMFYKWCTSCLCIICSTLVTKAQSLNFILSLYCMDLSLEEISLVNHYITSCQTEEMIVECDCAFSCVYVWAAFIQI